MIDEQQTLIGVDQQETLDLPTLETHLWKAADLLRGSINASDYENYIFGILSFKRVNDRFEEETDKSAEEHDIPEEVVFDDQDSSWESWAFERVRWDRF